MVMCADGNVDNFASIGQLDAKDWSVVGAGDYNGDPEDGDFDDSLTFTF